MRRGMFAKLQLEKQRQDRRAEIRTFYYYSRRELYTDKDYEARLLRIEDLFVKPAVKELVEDGDSSKSITRLQWSTIEKKLPKLIQDHVRLVEHDCYESLHIAHRHINKDVGLDENTNGVFDADYKMDPRLLNSATAFFSTKYYSATVQSYSDILRLRLTTGNPHAFYDPESGSSWTDLGVTANASAVEISLFLLKESGFAQWTSMQHLRSKGCSFKCRRCPKTSRCFMTWTQLV